VEFHPAAGARSRAGSRVALAIVFLVALAGSLSDETLAQTGLKLGGVIEDASGAPVPAIAVVLTPVDSLGNPTSGVVTRVKSNKKGKFTFGFAKAGDYKLSIESDVLQLKAVSISMRDADRKPVYGPDGLIEDLTGAVDPADPVIRLGIPREAYLVQVDLTVGEPSAPTASSRNVSAEIGAELAASNLGAEVEALLVRLQAQQYEAVAGEVQTLIEKNPELAALHYLHGYALVMMEDLPGAEISLREALRLSPEIDGASGLLGQILGGQGRFEEAIAALRHELDLPDNTTPRAPLLLALGQALLEVDRVDEAQVALEEALELEPDNEVTRVQLVDAYIRSGKDKQAEELLNVGLDKKSGAILHFNLAANMLRNERWEQGAEHMRQALVMDPGLVDAHRYLAQAYLALNRQPEAVEEFRAYVAAAPDAPDAGQIHQLIKALAQSETQQ
jgi:tetratricopeptide (TPR) repeat protein